MFHSDNIRLPLIKGESPFSKPEHLFVAIDGREYKGNPKEHAFMKLCQKNKIEQSFTRVKNPRTNGKTERVIKTLLDMWYKKTEFKSRVHRKQELIRFVNYYNTVKPHKGINNMPPMEKLISNFYPKEL